MLNTEKFVDLLVTSGYTALYCVPCSFATDLINSILKDGRINYFASANEGVACAQAAGCKMAGGKPFVIMQSTGIGNSVSVMTSLLIPYKIFFPIISSKRTWKEGDPEVQHAVLAKNLESLIEATGFEYEGVQTTGDSEVTPEERLISDMEECFKSNRVMILHNGTFTKVDYEADSPFFFDTNERIEFMKGLEQKFGGREDIIFIGTTGGTSREMYTHMPTCKKFLMAGSMGNLMAIATGAANEYEAAKRKVKIVALDGDSAFCMHMGSIINAANWSEKYKHAKLVHVVFDNGANATTGGQPSPLGKISPSDITKTIYDSSYCISDWKLKEQVEYFLSVIDQSEDDIRLVEVPCGSNTGLPPRPTVEDLTGSVKAFQ